MFKKRCKQKDQIVIITFLPYEICRQANIQGQGFCL